RFATILVNPTQTQPVKPKSGPIPVTVPHLMIGAHQIGGLERIKELQQQGNLLRVLDQDSAG
ncbi:MAG: hypothetical protein JO317_08360, partial [Verrucomicrobiae bacterium]|nr:hypothetical protein [Verrucomicrobiae bacterium]